MKSPAMLSRPAFEVEPDLDNLRNLVGQQPPQVPPPEVRERLLQRVKALRPALFSPPPALKRWGGLFALWLFITLAWIFPTGPVLRWECEAVNVAQFAVYRQAGTTWHLVGEVAFQATEYVFADSFYFPLYPNVTYLIVARDVNGQELHRVTVALPAWPTWLNVLALAAFSISAATFVVNWLHWRDLRHLDA